MEAQAKKLFLWVVPFWATTPLMYLGVAFVLLLPVFVALGETWAFFVIALLIAVAMGYWTHRTYRMTIIEHTDEAMVTRVEKRPREAATD